MMEPEDGGGVRTHPQDDGAAKVLPSASTTPQLGINFYKSDVDLNQPVPETSGGTQGFDVLKYVSLAERKWPPSPAKNPADKLACQPVTFLNQVPDLWDENGVEILPPSPEPDTRKPALGKVLAGTKEDLNKLMTESKYFEEDTGIILHPEKMTTSGKNGYRYEKFVSYEKSFSLGHGAFGKATVIMDKTSQASFVKKKIKRSEFRTEEVLVPLYLEHPCLVTIYGCILEGGKFVEVFMDFAGFSFNKVVGDEDMRKLLTEQSIVEIGRQGYAGLHYLRKKEVMHLDIKPQNLCLYWNNGRGFFDLKICDFGACMRAGDPIRSKGWTPAYMAPEQCRYVVGKAGHKGQWSEGEMEISGQADVHSFGSSLLYLCYWLHCIPKLFPSHSDIQIIIEVAKNPTVLQKFVLDSWDPKLKEVLLKSFCAHPRERLCPAQAIQILCGQDPVSRSFTAPMTDQSVRKRKASCLSVEDMEVDPPPPPKKIPTHVEEMEEEVGSPEVIIIDDPESSENLSPRGSPVGNLPDLDTLFS